MFTVEDLWEIAKSFWGSVINEMNAQKTPMNLPVFRQSCPHQHCTIDATLAFMKGDPFFQVIGDKPATITSRPGVTGLLMWLYNAAKAKGKPVDAMELCNRIRDNAVLRSQIFNNWRQLFINATEWYPNNAPAAFRYTARG